MLATKYRNEQTTYLQSIHCAGSGNLAKLELVKSQKLYTVHNNTAIKHKMWGFDRPNFWLATPL